MVGVGATPASKTLHPRERRAEMKADFRAALEVLVSEPKAREGYKSPTAAPIS
jgi:hypothetical protein